MTACLKNGNRPPYSRPFPHQHERSSPVTASSDSIRKTGGVREAICTAEIE